MIKRGTDKVFDSVNYILLAAIAIISFFPLYNVLCISLTDQGEYLKGGLILFPRGLTLANYQFLLSAHTIPKALLVSAQITLIGTFFSLIITSSFAYAISRKRMLGRKAILLMVLFTTLFNPGMIPQFLLIQKMGLLNSIWAIILPALSSGWNVFLMKSFFENIPESLEEAAIIDGCDDFGVWMKIILPLSLPAMATFGLFFAVAYWNTFFAALMYINKPQNWPIQVILRQMLIGASSGSDEGSQIISPEVIKMSAVFITITPIMMVYPFLQKHFAKGVMLGSVKG